MMKVEMDHPLLNEKIGARRREEIHLTKSLDTGRYFSPTVDIIHLT